MYLASLTWIIFERNLLRFVIISFYNSHGTWERERDRVESEEKVLGRPSYLKQTVPPEIVTQTTRSLLTPFRSPQTLDQPTRSLRG